MTQNKIVIIGSGVRECTILMKLKESVLASNYEFYTIGCNENPYLVSWSNFIKVENFDLCLLENLNILSDSNISAVIIGPEAPIANGLTEFLTERGIYCFAPDKKNGQIETSKLYAREFIEHNIHDYLNPQFKSSKNFYKDKTYNFTADEIIESLLNIKSEFKSKIVIKKDGLCGGKGVYVEGDHFNLNELTNQSNLVVDLVEYLKNCKNTILIEEKLEGIEFSIMTLTNGINQFVNLDPVFDYKRLENDDKGPNTGSMGSIILNKNTRSNFISNEIVNEANLVNEIIIKLLNEANNSIYKGILYGSFMKTTDNELKLIEFNCRLGDPDGALSLLNTNLDFLDFVLNSKGDVGYIQTQPEKLSKDKNLVGVYCVPEPYPQKPISEINYDIYFRNNLYKINENTLQKGVIDDETILLYGDCILDNDRILTNRSRTIMLVVKNDYLYKAVNSVYKNIGDIVSRLKYRSDIGSKYISKYEMAGVSITNANNTLLQIKENLKKTYNLNVKSELGDFGGVYNLNSENLVSSIDGVGTKTDFVDKYFLKEDYEGLGMDIVNHSINDILVMGAKPLFFLDYYGTSQLDACQFASFIKGACNALCIDENTKVPLIGGETAEMPTVYKWEKNDIVGCIIGKLDHSFVKYLRPPMKGDCLLGLRSEGPHTNGFSLINNIPWSQELLDKSPISQINLEGFFDYLRTPHCSYFTIVREILDKYGPSSFIRMCHITGGGLYENLERVIPKNLELHIDNLVLNNMYPQWCNIIEIVGNISKEEMYRVFNCGIGFVLIVSEELKTKLLKDEAFNLEIF